MITNEREFRITKAQLDKLRAAAAEFDIAVATKHTHSLNLAQAEFAALQSQLDDLSMQLREYEALKSGAVTVLKAENLSDLPSILIRARIAQGLSQRGLAEKLDLKEQQIQRYEAEGYASASLKRLTEVADVLKLNITEIAELNQPASPEKKTSPQILDWSRFPVAEMYKRNWFEGFSGSLAAAKGDADMLIATFVAKAVRHPSAVLHRKHVRSGSVFDPYALLAWQCRVLTLAKSFPPSGTYRQNCIDDNWLKALVRHSRFPDGPRRAQKHLEEAGISMVIEPHLSSTHLDGAAFLGDDAPVIALTLRYDRLDNFWFVLLHEVIHVKKHLRKGRVDDIFDDLDATPDALEREADELACEALIPGNVWETELARYVRTAESVKALAEKLKVAPAIIAGRIRKEAENYVILNDMVGQGEVRKLFPQVIFGQ